MVGGWKDGDSLCSMSGEPCNKLSLYNNKQSALAAYHTKSLHSM